MSAAGKFYRSHKDTVSVPNYRAVKYAVRNNLQSHTYFPAILHECLKLTCLRHSRIILHNFATQLEILLPRPKMSVNSEWDTNCAVVNVVLPGLALKMEKICSSET
jgi:hypothetical protein